MATKSTSTADASEHRQSSPAVGSEVPESAGRDGNIVKEDEPSGKPLFAISEPLREDQVQNAVKFLSHPRVRGSPVMHRRSFLEKKGLTKEEIDEAFRRVPDPPSGTTNVETAATKPVAAQTNSVTTLQPHAPVQATQSVMPSANGVTTVTSLQKYRFQWSHALFAIGVLAASGAGTAILFKNMVVPRLKGWIRKVVAEENESPTEDDHKSKMVEEATEAAKAAASAATVVAEASKELLSAKTDERKYFESFMGALDVQVKEMKSMSDAIHRLESRREDRFYQEKPTGEYIQPTSGNGPANPSWRTSQNVQVNGTPYTDFGEARPSSAPAYMNPTSAPAYMNPTSAPAYMNPTSAPYSNSYMPGMNTTAAQRGEKPSGVKPWEVNQQTQERRSYSLQSQSTNEEFSSEVQGTIQSSQVNGKAQDNSDPWWNKRNVKITEVDSELSEIRQFSYGSDAAQKPKPRAWVPPQPPSVVMPEAAAAIRQPKSSQKQSSGDDRSVVSSVDGEAGVPTGEMNSAAQMENLDSGVPVEYGRDGIQEERADGIEAN